MIADTPIFHYFRVALEAETPHGIHSGKGDITHDVLLVRDVNGLPAIPATSLAGVLRHLYTQHFGSQEAQQLFGYTLGDSGKLSALNVTWGLIHNSLNQPMEGIRQDLNNDPLLQILTEDKPLVRQRVRLNSLGSAVDTGKFDTTMIPAGARYSCFLSIWSDGSEQQESSIERLLSLLGTSAFRLGHGTRAGQGAFKVLSIDGARWDLRTPQGQQGYRQRPRQRATLGNLAPIETAPLNDSALRFTLQLTAEAGWRIGGGEQPFSQPDQQGRTPDLLPQSELCIRWNEQQQAELHKQQAVVPATAIKGALSHRLAFHYRRLNGNFAEQSPVVSHLECPVVQEIFGTCNDTSNEQTGVAGRLIINDLYLDDTTATRQMHNRIDQFTGGVMNSALFEEELLWQTPLTLNLSLQHPEEISPLAKQALTLTLQDLTQGWLAIGAGGSRGHGCFHGEIQCSDTRWLTEQEEAV